MKFIVDAQLPKLLAQWLRQRGYDAIHTLELPDKNRTGDDIINQISLQENRIVISKDSDFYHRYFRNLEPYKLIYLTTGNIPILNCSPYLRKIWSVSSLPLNTTL